MLKSVKTHRVNKVINKAKLVMGDEAEGAWEIEQLMQMRSKLAPDAAIDSSIYQVRNEMIPKIIKIFRTCLTQHKEI